MTGRRMLFHFNWQLVALLWLQPDGLQAQSTACLEGFTQDLPPQDQWSQFSTSSISPNSEVVFTSVRFTCNGTLEALNVPISLRGSDYLYWDRVLVMFFTVWRQSKAHIVRIERERANKRIDNKGLELVDTQTGQTFMLNSSGVLQFTETVDISINIMENDTMGASVPGTISRNISGTMKEIVVADHWPLLFHRDTQIPLISANFIPSTSPTTDEETSPETSASEFQGDNQRRRLSIFITLTIVMVLVLLLAAAVIAIIIVIAVKLRKRKSSVLVGGSRYRSGKSLIRRENSESVQPLIVYNIDSAAPEDNTPAEYTYARSARNRVRLPTPPFPTTVVPPQVEETPIVDYEGISHVPSSAQRQSMEMMESKDGEEHCYSIVQCDGYSQLEASNDSENELYWDPGNSADDIFNQMSKGKYIEIPLSSVMKEHKLGEGEFGEVFKGEWTTPVKTLTVALKTLKSSASEEERLKLLQEAAIMGQFIHPHIVRLYGVVTLSEMVSVVMEFLSGGDLRSYLLEIRESEALSDLPDQLLRFCQEIADAMDYLSKKGYIHRDLAARNILLTADVKCKLADFGMSHDMNEEYYYKLKGGRIPVKWTAPEAILYRKYTTKSDVWSYGMVMYEIWSLGHKPFEEWDSFQVAGVFNDTGGYCHPPPPGCPREVYAIMVQCWHPDYHSRVSFTEVVQSLNYDQRALLKVDPRDKTGTPLSLTLGAPLEHGQELHKDLQDTYKE